MNRSDRRRGLGDVTPLLPGIVPFGLVAGIAAADAGLRLVDALAMSVVVFAGASQLVALDLLGNDAPLAGAATQRGLISSTGCGMSRS